ncbi:MAG TPA: Clp protease N-terminal domain-containing protein, partial [Acidimicrobiales bacterium]|nr:Clp protease N-terminal domain-containing protein [Acidimicrobiales bacterium]
MLERLSDRAGEVLESAQREVRRLNENVIGTEHILLGLVEYYSTSRFVDRAPESLKVSIESVREEVEKTIGRAGRSPAGVLTFRYHHEESYFTQRAEKLLELSVDEARQLGRGFIAPEHLLLGLVREGEGIGVQVLVSLGVDLSEVRQEVLSQLG